MNCLGCDAQLSIPQDAVKGEVISCMECGASYVVEIDDSGIVSIQQLEVEEDWGE